MLWFILALITAILASTNDILRKFVSQKVNILTIPFLSVSITFLIMLLYSFFRGIPEVQAMFFVVVLLNASLNTLVQVLYIYALKHGDISAGIPMLSFTPAFMIATSFFILGEFPNFFGITGILLVTAGAYLLTTRKKAFELLRKETSPKIFLLISFIWSITANLDKLGTKLSTPEFYITCVSLFIALFLSPFVLRKSLLYQIKTNAKFLSSIGVVNALMLLAQMNALLLANASYVIATKRLSTVFSTIFGGKFFKEKDLKKRSFASIIMFLGVFLILVLG